MGDKGAQYNPTPAIKIMLKLSALAVDRKSLYIDLLLVVKFIPTESCKLKGIAFCLAHTLHGSRQTQNDGSFDHLCPQKSFLIYYKGLSFLPTTPPTDLQSSQTLNFFCEK